MTKRTVASLPKAHLHLHLTGAMRPSTLRELAERADLPVPPPLPAGLVGSWADFQQRYDAARAVIRSAADVARVVAEAAADDAADGCGWLEIQVDPTSYAARLGGVRAALEAVLAAAAQACIPTGVVVASSWARSGEHALRLARLAGEYSEHGVVGFGLSNDERRGQVVQFEAAFRVAAEAGLPAVPHSGFYTGAEHVRDCVELLGARRIGHGTSAVTDPAVLELLARRGVAVEVCPTSYPPFGVHELSEVPVPALLDAGVPVALAAPERQPLSQLAVGDPLRSVEIPSRSVSPSREKGADRASTSLTPVPVFRPVGRTNSGRDGCADSFLPG